MSLHLSELVVSGEIYNTSHYAVHGWLELRGTDRPLSLQLTGNPDADLAGRHFRFEARGVPAESRTALSDAGAEVDYSHIAWQQVGPTGTMTAARQVRVADVPLEELLRRCELGEPPPTHWKPCLYLEWYSQNGRVVVELVDPLIEFLEDEEDDEDGDGPLDADLSEGTGDFDGFGLESDSFGEDDDLFSGGEPADADDPYGLFPDDLQKELDARAWETDRLLDGDEDASRTLRELELMDELIETSDGEPISTLFDTPRRFPRPDDLTDDEAEAALKALLSELALYGVALDVCPHFTPRDAYRLLLEEISVESRVYPELRQTQWVQHFMTSEYCDACDQEMQIEYGDDARDPGERPDDDIPF